MRQSFTVMLSLLVALGGCSKKGATSGQTATLALKDGTTVTGTVAKSDTSSITVQTPNGVVSTYPLNQVNSVSYEPAAGTPSNAPPSEPPAQQPSSAPSSGSAEYTEAPTAGPRSGTGIQLGSGPAIRAR